MTYKKNDKVLNTHSIQGGSMDERANESMITMTIRVSPELSRTLKQAGERLGTHYTTLVRQCLIAIVNPSEFGDMVLDSVRAAGVSYVETIMSTNDSDV